MSISREEYMAIVSRRYIVPSVVAVMVTFLVAFVVCWAVRTGRHERFEIAFWTTAVVAVASFAVSIIGMRLLSRSIRRS